MHRHEIDRFRRHLLCRHYQIAFVLAVGVVSHDNDAALGDFAYHIVDRVELKCLRRPCNHRDNTITSSALMSNSYSHSCSCP